jgi:hypothetical protein
MARTVRDYGDARRMIESQKYRAERLKRLQTSRDALTKPLAAPDIYAFLLFDNRPSHRAIEQFAADQLGWLDHLARSAQIIMFVYIGKHAADSDEQKDAKATNDEDLAKERIALVHSKEEFQNPGLEIARDLGIRPNQLPGIALFTTLSDERAAVFFPLKSALFEKEAIEIERVLADFFSIIQECQEGASTPDQLLSQLRARIDTLRRTEQARPILLYAKEALLTIIRLPITLPQVAGTAFAQTFAQETARRIAGP